ncbi:GerAB/ArcD/ProY family transporter [Bacillus megaterium NBRC 15308 = ATCC 14581]|nr:GerAB/ArcD/ProY family transporter [Priestia megaterium NBRC 15308 = ATCC 14581]
MKSDDFRENFWKVLKYIISYLFLNISYISSKRISRDYSVFLLSNTPIFVTIGVFLLVAIYHVRGGMYSISKVFSFLFPITFLYTSF